MPTKIFNELDNDKKSKIIDVALLEFAKNGYDNSSTNKIVKEAGISKGSLFKYFTSKEELYFYILDLVSAELVSDLASKKDELPKELFQRVIKYCELEFAWYISNPEKYKMIINAFTKNDTEIYRKIEERYELTGHDIYYELLEDIELSDLKWDKQKVINILKWLLNGFNEEFMSRVIVKDSEDIDSIRREYVNSLEEHIEILKEGFVK